MFRTRFLLPALLAVTAIPFAFAQPAGDARDRTILPIQQPARPVYTELDARTVQPPHFEVKAPPGAPNVGIDLGTPAVEVIGAEARSRFSGHIREVRIDVKS